jgi:hypothetical protein
MQVNLITIPPWGYGKCVRKKKKKKKKKKTKKGHNGWMEF